MQDERDAHDQVAAKLHLDTFYTALDSVRKSIASFYYPSTELPDGKHVPSIIYNGNNVSDGNIMQSIFVDQIPPTHHELQSFDCQVVNTEHVTEHQQEVDIPRSKNISFLIAVSGSVRVGESQSAKQRGFSESFLLVPNEEAFKTKRHAKQEKEFLISFQSFRYVV